MRDLPLAPAPRPRSRWVRVPRGPLERTDRSVLHRTAGLDEIWNCCGSCPRKRRRGAEAGRECSCTGRGRWRGRRRRRRGAASSPKSARLSRVHRPRESVHGVCSRPGLAGPPASQGARSLRPCRGGWPHACPRPCRWGRGPEGVCGCAAAWKSFLHRGRIAVSLSDTAWPWVRWWRSSAPGTWGARSPPTWP